MEKQNERVLAYKLATEIDREALETVTGGDSTGTQWTCYDSLSVTGGSGVPLVTRRDCDIDG
ncbi:MAG: hypothetical protein NTW94_05235 [Legionellales bacterium]|nr:hypothetical protein [Legionellales bacterium]